MVDEIAVIRFIEWDCKQFRGYVNLYSGVDDIFFLFVTENALAYMVASIVHGKFPVVTVQTWGQIHFVNSNSTRFHLVDST